METKKATINRSEHSTSLILEGRNTSYELVLTDDNPNNIKAVFNDLIKDLKKGIFNYELEDDTDDLYKNISKEYITQLNIELNAVYGELQSYKLIEIIE